MSSNRFCRAAHNPQSTVARPYAALAGWLATHKQFCERSVRIFMQEGEPRTGAPFGQSIFGRVTL